MSFPAQCAQRGTAPPGRGALAGTAASLGKVQLGLVPQLSGALPWRWQGHTGTARLGKSDGDGLLGRARTVFALPDMMNFFADELSGLRGGRPAFGLVPFRAFNGFAFRHNYVLLCLTREARRAFWPRPTEMHRDYRDMVYLAPVSCLPTRFCYCRIDRVSRGSLTAAHPRHV
jgi:hypothetical protein